MEQGRLIIISGFSGVGKGTVIKRLMQMYPGEYAFSVSATTRSPRPGETDGVEYYFVSHEEFERMIADGELLEYTRYQTNYYGTPARPVDEQLGKGMNIILDIEIEGAGNVKAMRPEAISVFVIPPAAEELERRLTGRGSETPEQIRGRLERACEESEFIDGYDYILVNETVDRSVDELRLVTLGLHQGPEEHDSKAALGHKVADDLREYIKQWRNA